MQPAQLGDRITILYDGKLENDEVFESSSDTGPISFTLGDGSVMPAFEAAIIGMLPGETKIIKIMPENAYGLHIPELVHKVSRAAVNPDCEITPGMVVGLNMEVEGKMQKVPATITSLEGEQVTVDFNHPLAGQELLYRITLQSIDQQPEDQTGCGCSSDSDSGGGCGHC
jgi:FKBP-type peptidyl-prolyl cis-trans isomerase 2